MVCTGLCRATRALCRTVENGPDAGRFFWSDQISMELTFIAALLSAALLLSNLASILLASSRLKRPRTIAPPAGKTPPVSILVPSRGVEPFTEETLARAFSLDWPHYELIFCVAHADDPVVRLIRAAIARFPKVPARLLVGDDRISGNPKLNNCVKGWEAAQYDWVILADSNVLMPKDYVQHLMAAWRPGPALSVPRRSARGLRVSGRRSSAPSSTRCRRAGSTPARHSASVSPRARACCGTSRCWTQMAASSRLPPRSPRMPPRPNWSMGSDFASILSPRPSSSRSAAARLAKSGRARPVGRACAASPSLCSSRPRS
jgi:hypothetical protein